MSRKPANDHGREVIMRHFKPGRIQLDFMYQGKRQRPVIDCIDQAAAQAMASQVAIALQAQRLGITAEDPLNVVARLQGRAPVVDLTGPTIKEAMTEAIQKGSQAREDWKGQLEQNAKRFRVWIKSSYPGIPDRWKSITFSIVQEYMQTTAGLSQDRISHLLAPIRLTARYWERQAPELYRDVTIGVRLPESKPRKEPLALSPEQLRELLRITCELQPTLYPLIAISSFTGLRVFEAAHLRLCDVDLIKGTIRVTDTDTHRPKNKGSYRTLPVGTSAVAVLKANIARNQPVNVESALFMTAHGLPWNKKRLDEVWKRFRAQVDVMPLKEGQKESDRFKIVEGYTLRGSRRTFVTLARKGGADRELLKRYIGHAAADVLGQHYDAMDQVDLRTVCEAFEAVFNPGEKGKAAKHG